MNIFYFFFFNFKNNTRNGVWNSYGTRWPGRGEEFRACRYTKCACVLYYIKRVYAMQMCYLINLRDRDFFFIVKILNNTLALYHWCSRPITIITYNNHKKKKWYKNNFQRKKNVRGIIIIIITLYVYTSSIYTEMFFLSKQKINKNFE